MLRLLLVMFAATALSAAELPNILWIVFEDLSPEIGAYGDPYAVTPNIDAFARQSVLYTQAFSNGGACAPARSTLITGMYPTAIGTHHMRSEGRPPSFVRGFPEYLREAGYYTSNHSKLDYNWIAPDSLWDTVDNDWREKGWRQRGDKPFFTVVNITETHSSQTYQPWVDWDARRQLLAESERHDPALAIVPPYYPDTPDTREILKRYADNVTFADREVGEILAQLEADGLAGETIVFFYSDHGTGLPRSKSFQFESSTRVPLLVRVPGKHRALAPAGPGEALARLVAFIDFPATVLSLAGVPLPTHFQGTPFLGEAAAPPPAYVFGYRDRMDERYEFIRSVRDARFRYIRNFFPHLPWFHDQTRLYPSTNPLLSTWHRLSLGGALDGPAATYMAATKPPEQLFDVSEDPHELRNLASDPRYARVLERMRGALEEWILETHDLGFLPEGEMWLAMDGAAYDAVRSDSAAYPLDELLEISRWGNGAADSKRLAQRLSSSSPSVRFWAATGLVAQGSAAAHGKEALRGSLGDPSPDVRTAAAQALCQAGECAEALAVLLANLSHEQEYVALRAANTLDHLDELAAPALPQMRAALAGTEQLGMREFFRQTGWSEKVLRAAVAEFDVD